MDENKELIEEAQEKREDGTKFYLVVRVSIWTKMRNYILQKINWIPKQKKTTIWNKIDQMLLKIKGQEAEPVKIKIEK